MVVVSAWFSASFPFACASRWRVPRRDTLRPGRCSEVQWLPVVCWTPLSRGEFWPLGSPKSDRFSVGIGGVCGLLANGHYRHKTFGGKSLSASAFGRGRQLMSPSLGAHALNVGAGSAGSLLYKAEGSLRNFSGGRRTVLGNTPRG
jgi:hypothetical protein